MAHPQQLMFFSIINEMLGKKKNGMNVLEIGSYDITGSVRQFFNDCEYTGCDLTEGPGVDLVCSGHDLNFPENSYGITLSSECFEHNPYWTETFMNMYRMTKPGGLVLITCASTGRAEHGTERTTDKISVSPGTSAIGWDYYKNLTKRDFKKNLKLDTLFDKYFIYYMPTSCDLYFCGQKKGSPIFNFDKDALLARMAEIKSIPIYQNISSARYLLLKLHSFPIWFMSKVLDDITFQNARIRYLNSVRPLKVIINKIFS